MRKTTFAPGQLLRSVHMEKSYLGKAGYPVLYNGPCTEAKFQSLMTILILKVLGFLVLAKRKTPCKILCRRPGELELVGLTACIMFYNIC